MDVAQSRRIIAAVAGVAIAAAVMLAGSYVLLGTGEDYAAGGPESSPSADSGGAGKVISDVRTTTALDPDVALVTVPLGVDFKVPGVFYGAKAEAPIQLDLQGDKGMTQDCFGRGQAGLVTPDGRYLLYHYCRWLRSFPSEAPGEPSADDGTPLATPSIRILDLETGKDSVLVAGARSMAWRADGMFAYAQGVEPDYRYNERYLQRVVVQQGLDGTPVPWTKDEDFYSVVQWAGDSLLVWRELPGAGEELVAFDGPNKARVVLRPEEGTLVSVSPDGSRLLVWSGGPTQAENPLTLREIDLKSGRQIARLSLDGATDPASGEPITAILSGTWEGDRVVVSLTRADLAVISAKGDGLELERIVTLSYPKRLPDSIDQLRLEGENRVIAVVSEGSDPDELERTSVIVYDLLTGACTRWVAPNGRAMTLLVYNPSRPL